MRIAQIVPLYETVPPRTYGGTERVVAYLTDALVALGHDVTLFAASPAGTRARLVPCRERALRAEPGLSSDLAAHIVMLTQLRALAEQFDVLHFHIDLLHLPMFERHASRSLTTLHGRLDMQDLAACYQSFPAYPLVAISHHQRQVLPWLNWAGVVHHGLPAVPGGIERTEDAGYLAFLGRISPEKDPAAAIEIAKRAGLPLKLAAKIDAVDQAYFKAEIAPLLDHPLIHYVGEISDAEKPTFLGNARALLFPIAWPEPFGLAMIEAMANGTPVVAFDRGAVREIIELGITGCIVQDVAGAVAALPRLAALDRGRIRARFERRFSARAMAAAYLDLYRAISQPTRQQRRGLLAAAAPT